MEFTEAMGQPSRPMGGKAESAATDKSSVVGKITPSMVLWEK